MSRYAPLSFACALVLCLALPGLSQYARAQTPKVDAGARPTAMPQTGITTQKPGTAAPASPARGKAEERMFKDVPADSALYAAVSDLQQQGVLLNYPEGYFRGRRPLTYYEFSIAVARTVKDWDALTLAPDGKTMQTVVAVPRSLSHDQAQTLLNVWTEIRADVAAAGFGQAKTNLIIRTLRAYVNLLTNTLPDFTLHIGMNPGGSKKEQKQ